MDEQIKQIAERLRGLRDAMELTTEELANECGIDPKEYEQAESGEYDISVSMMQQIARRYGIALDALMFGEEPKMNTYFLTRAGKGVSINISHWLQDSRTGKPIRSLSLLNLTTIRCTTIPTKARNSIW